MLPILLVGLYGAVQGVKAVSLVDHALSKLENVRWKSTHKIVVRKDGKVSREVDVYTAHEFRLLREGNDEFQQFVNDVHAQADWRDPIAELLLEGLVNWTHGRALLDPLARDIKDPVLRDQITQAVGEAWARQIPAQQDLLFRWARMLDVQQATDQTS